MKLMTILPRRLGCYGPTDSSVALVYLNSCDDATGYTVFTVQQTWTLPCPDTFAVSYYYEVYWDYPAPNTLAYTSGTFTGTLTPPSTVLLDDFNDGINNPGAVYYYLKLYVTWPDSTVTSYTTDEDGLDICS